MGFPYQNLVWGVTGEDSPILWPVCSSDVSVDEQKLNMWRDMDGCWGWIPPRNFLPPPCGAQCSLYFCLDVSCFKLRSLIHLELAFVKNTTLVSFFCRWTSSLASIICWVFFSACLFCQELDGHSLISFYPGLWSVQWSVLMPGCLYLYTSRVYFGGVYNVRTALTVSHCLSFHMNPRIIFIASVKYDIGILMHIALNL